MAFEHEHRTCPVWLASRPAASGNQAGNPQSSNAGEGERKKWPNPNMCLTCKAANKRCEHFFRTCPVLQDWMERKAKKAPEKKAATPPTISENKDTVPAKPAKETSKLTNYKTKST